MAPYSLADLISTFLEEDLIVAEILPRLHVKALFKFKCVSNRYNSIISDPKFVLNYVQRAYTSPESSSSSGLLVLLLFPFTGSHASLSNNIKDFDSTTHYWDNPLSIPVSSLSLPYNDSHKILASSNGLILSSFTSRNHADEPKFTLCVSNPLTKQCVKLPDMPMVYNRSHKLISIATRRRQALFTYKIVSIQHYGHGNDSFTSIEVFSSDTGVWAIEIVRNPRGVFFLPSAGFSYKGIFYWLHHLTGTVITYDPYDSPDRFGCIQLPNGMALHPKLVFSGEEETLKYCEIDECEPGVTGMSVWRLVDSDKGEWLMEGKFRVSSLVYVYERVMVAMIPWNRDIFCHPYFIGNKLRVMNLRSGMTELVDVFSMETESEDCSIVYRSPLIPVELCPWSSPFYAGALTT